MSIFPVGEGYEMFGDDHLGGYIIGGDPATYYPELWRWLINILEVRSVIDVGCGDGVAVDFFAQEGCAVLGVDGVPQEHSAIIEHDYTRGPWPMDVHVERCDMIWSCEFVEHVEERYITNFLHTFVLAKKYIVMTHADPGQGGYHHVNCQTSDYWRGVMSSIGFTLSPDLTSAARWLSKTNTEPLNHFARSGLVFFKSGL